MQPRILPTTCFCILVRDSTHCVSALCWLPAQKPLASTPDAPRPPPIWPAYALAQLKHPLASPSPSPLPSSPFQIKLEDAKKAKMALLNGGAKGKYTVGN